MNQAIIVRNASDDVKRFQKHVHWIRGLVQKSYSHVLSPWKLNQNVSISTQEDAFGNALLRVICLQPHGNPGVMQVEVNLTEDTAYDMRFEGCTLPSIDGSKFRACPFIDKISPDRTSSLVKFDCGKPLRMHPEAAEGEMPCSDLDFHRGMSESNRYERALSFTSSSGPGAFRIGVLFNNALPGDTFFLKQVCWKPSVATSWDCGYSPTTKLPGK